MKDPNEAAIDAARNDADTIKLLQEYMNVLKDRCKDLEDEILDLQNEIYEANERAGYDLDP